jgi:hypothetical protein
MINQETRSAVFSVLFAASAEQKNKMKTKMQFNYLALAGLILICFALSPMAQAVSPPPDGGYAGANTAEGNNALLSLTTGSFNTAIGAQVLENNTIGSDNTATGAFALNFNTSGNANTATRFFCAL